jgi:hypothetical protein
MGLGNRILAWWDGEHYPDAMRKPHRKEAKQGKLKKYKENRKPHSLAEPRVPVEIEDLEQDNFEYAYQEEIKGLKDVLAHNRTR